MDDVWDCVVDGDHAWVLLLQLLDQVDAGLAWRHCLHLDASHVDGRVPLRVLCAGEGERQHLEARSKSCLADRLAHLARATVDQQCGLGGGAHDARGPRGGPQASRLQS
jgi:hypothetical protein